MHFDSNDMDNFETFFKNLYSDNHKTINKKKNDDLINAADCINIRSVPSKELNGKFTIPELKRSIRSLKSGKASSIDMISNEIIKLLDEDHLQFLLKLFDLCLESHKYPWNESVIFPLHKKGVISNPDNYRAIAISSVIGKLFSSILLERLKNFRLKNCPDPPNQLGFTKGAQTYDHILTMSTIASKYKKIRKPVYAVFVDFKKAFDSVCRQALFYKLAKLGITGNIYNVLRNMYSNSSAYIKLSGHLSNKIDILKGTKQGHPLSPDLFKIFINDLSPLLEIVDCPNLSKTSISHLLWADDLIMLSLNTEGCKYQLNKLESFCKEWGIEVNELKTQVMILGRDGKNSRYKNLVFNFESKTLEIVDSYCYLGIILHSSGELKTAQSTLKLKAMRAFFGLKRTVIRSKLSFKALNTLFDSLIKPIALYGAPIWTPECTINKSVIKYFKSSPQTTHKFISKINRVNSEKLHLAFLKWALGVHRKSSNIGVWGESGRYPLIYESIRLTLNYYNRLMSAPANSFVKAALKEQKKLKLPWYKNIEPLLKIDDIYHLDHVTAHRITNSPTITKKGHSINCQSAKLPDGLASLTKSQPLPCKKFRVQTIIKLLKDHFVQCWEHEKSSSPKLIFYHQNKTKFAREVYLDVTKGFSRRYSTTKLRISSHDLEIESGRYYNMPRESRVCHWCSTSMGVKKLEDENHMLFDCDLYAELRAKLILRLKNVPVIENNTNEKTTSLKINAKNLKTNYAKMLSPYIIPNINETPLDGFNNHHKLLMNRNLKVVTPELENLLYRRSYIINCICTHIYCSFEKRKKYLNSVKQLSNSRNILIFNFR